MDKTALNAQLVAIRVKLGFNHLKPVDCEISDLWKSFGLFGNENNDRLDFAAC